MSKKEIFFFATKDDLLPGLMEIEAERPLNYVPVKAHDHMPVASFGSARDITKLGTNTSGNHQSESFLVLDKEESVQVREVRQESGAIKYFVSQDMNTKSILFWPGGFYDEKHVISGHVGTISGDPVSQGLYKRFSHTLTKGFVKRGGYYVGPQILERTANLRLITMNVNQPLEYDLKL